MKHHTRSAETQIPCEIFVCKVSGGTFACDQRNAGDLEVLIRFLLVKPRNEKSLFAVQGFAVPIDIQTKPEITNSHRNDAFQAAREKHIWINLREICKLFINLNEIFSLPVPKKKNLKRRSNQKFYFHWWQLQRNFSCCRAFFIDHAFLFIHFHSVFMLTTRRLNKAIVNCGRIQGNWRLITKFDRLNHWQLHFINSRQWKRLHENCFQTRVDRWTRRLIDPDFHRRLRP